MSSCLEDCEVLQTVITRSQGRFESERQNVPVVDQEEDTEEGRDITDTVENKTKTMTKVLSHFHSFATFSEILKKKLKQMLL